MYFEFAFFVGIVGDVNAGFSIWHMKNKGVQQSHASSRNSEAIDVLKVAPHTTSGRVVACDDYSF